MKFLTTPMSLLLAGIFLLAARDASAQNRGGGLRLQDQSQQIPQGGFGQTAQGSLGATGSLGLGQQRQPGGATQRPNGMLSGRGLQAGNRQDNFVGSDAQQLRNQLNNRNPGQMRRAMFDFAIENFNEMRESRRQERADRNQKPSVRVQLRPLFTVAQPSASALAAQASAQLRKFLPTTVDAARISIRGGTATISGVVKSEYDKQLAAKMLSLQPGISQIENQLTIEPVQAERLLLPAR